MREFTINLVQDLVYRLSDDDQGLFIVAGFIILLIVGIFAILWLLIALIFGKKDQQIPGAQATQAGPPVMGRLQKLEDTLNGFKTESARAQEFYNVEFKWIRSELQGLKNLLEERDPHGPGGGGGGGGGGGRDYRSSEGGDDEWDFLLDDDDEGQGGPSAVHDVELTHEVELSSKPEVPKVEVPKVGEHVTEVRVRKDVSSKPVPKQEVELRVEPEATLETEELLKAGDTAEDLIENPTAEPGREHRETIGLRATVVTNDLRNELKARGVELQSGTIHGSTLGEIKESKATHEESIERTENKRESLSVRLMKTRAGFFNKLRGVFSGGPKLELEMLEEIEAQLITSDIGAKTVTELMKEVRDELSRGEEVTQQQFTSKLKAKIHSILSTNSRELPILPKRQVDGPFVVMIVGVNGAGKTTTAAKLAHNWKASGLKVMLAAADTFRAAAVEQLCQWGERMDVSVIRGAENAKPSTVVFTAMEQAKEQEVDVLIIDTAGRLHTKANLMQELEGVRNIMQRHQQLAPHETLLVVDGSTGQNAISQAKEFHGAVPLDGLVVTKLDGTPKGGVIVAIKNDLGIPVHYIGVGEGEQDLRPFVVDEFVDALFDERDLTESSVEISAHGQKRRRRRRRDTSWTI